MHDFLIRAHQFLAVVFHAPIDDFACGRKDLHDGVSCDGFAGAGFTDDTQHFSAIYAESHVFNSPDFACVGEKGGMEILYFK